MLVVGIIFSVGFLGIIIYFAISGQSPKKLKISAIIALGLICVSILICGIIIVKGPSGDKAEIPIPVFLDSEAPVKKDRHIVDLLVLGALLLVLSLVIAKGLKDQRKKTGVPSKSRGRSGAKPEESLIFPDEVIQNTGSPVGGDDDSFELDDFELK